MEDVRMLVQEEGRAARNLIAFHVDLTAPVNGKTVNRKPPSSPRFNNETRMTKRSSIATKTGSRVRSASTGRDKKSELQARYWAFLFSNLERAVDEIYQTCETDESVSECKEVILVLENFTREFHGLIEWFKLKWEYENTPPPQRPTSLAWEVRKSSPGKVMALSRLEKKSQPDKQTPVKKQLNFLSDVKLSSAEEFPKRAFTFENELSNRYGLSFGDVNLKDHLKSVENVIEESNCNSESPPELPESKPNREIDKENKPTSVTNIVDDVCKSQIEIFSSNQSSQTEEYSLQNNKVSSRLSTASSIPAKRPTTTVKSGAGSLAKSITLSPLAVNKTVPSTSSRKTVPISPTNTVPHRALPGRNVAAVAFVPGKKTVPVTSAKINTNLSRCNNNLGKTQIVFQQSNEKNMIVGVSKEENIGADVNKLIHQSKTELNENLKNSDYNKEFKFKMECLTKIDLEEFTNNPKNNADQSEIQATPNDIRHIEESTVGTTAKNIPTEQEDNKNKSEVNTSKIDTGKKEITLVNENINVIENPIQSKEGNKTNVNACMNISKTQEVNNNDSKIVKSGNDNVSVIQDISRNKQKGGVGVKVLTKPQKCDKSIMTDVSFLSQSAKQVPSKVTSLVRNKTLPNLVRKSSETTTASDITGDTLKNVRNSTVNLTKTVIHPVKKQGASDSVPEKLTNEKAPYSTVSKVYRSNTAFELRPSKVGFNRNVTSASTREIRSEQQVPTRKRADYSAKNSAVMKKCNSLFKSEQTLPKKNSVDEDGWETVKGRSRWRLSQSSGNIKARTVAASSRFFLPSPATSLPALALGSEHCESDPKPAKLHKDRQNQEIAKANKAALKSKNSEPASKQPGKPEISTPIKRNKKEDAFEKKSVMSDRKKISNNKMRSVNLNKNNNGVKSDNGEIKIDKLLDILSSEDERINEEEIRKSMELYEEEQMLTKKIKDLEKAEIEVDTETDETETEGEVMTGVDEDDTNCRISALKASYENVCHQLSWADQMDTLEKLEQLMAMDTSTKGIPMAERLSTLEQLEELVARHPGRALELHQKLSSPSRRRPLPDTIQRHRARQESAQLKREQLLQDKSARMRELLNKVEEVKMAQAQLVEERKKRLADKLKRAEENRASHLRSIQRKAHDEEEKLREIAFINELEAQNKRHDFMALCQEQQERLQGILDERQRRQEEKAAKEAAVEERRRMLEAERQEKLEKMQERRRKREERIGREQQEKEKERLELAREKARDREERLQALQAAQLANVEELQKKIQQKQFDSARRHEENIEHIRQRALESGALRGSGDEEAPRLTPYDTHKLCRVCNILIESEIYLLSHLRGKAHQEAIKEMKEDSDSVIIDAPPDKMNAKLAQNRERQKALRKRCKKIRSRMAQRGEEYLAKLGSESLKKCESPNKNKILKCIKSVEKLHASQGIGQWPNNAITLLERNLSEINRILDKQIEEDQKVFKEMDGFTMLSNILNLALDIPKNMNAYLPPKCFLTTCIAYSLACTNNPDNSRFVFFSNKIALVLDLLLNRLNVLITDDYKTSNKSSTNLQVDPVAGALMKLFALILSYAQENVPNDMPDIAPRLQDIISYTVSMGVVDKLALYCSSVRDPIDNNPQVAQFLLSAITLITTLAQTRCGLVKGDPTQLLATLRVTELVGGVSMLYGMLLQQGASPNSTPPSLPPHTVQVTMATLKLLKAVAQLDLTMFQSVLGAEGISLQLRHIASYLLWYCSNMNTEDWLQDKRDLLHQVIEVVGYFAVMHYDNQMMLQSGHMPTVLQQLCNLPFEYFSNPSLSCHLFPTLLACCHGNQENRTILEQELNYQLLEDFRNSEIARTNPLVQLIK